MIERIHLLHPVMLAISVRYESIMFFSSLNRMVQTHVVQSTVYSVFRCGCSLFHSMWIEKRVVYFATWWLMYFFFIVVFCQDADVIVTDLASAIKQIFPTVPLKYIIRKVMCHTLIHRMHSCVVVINADPLSFCIYLLPSPMFVVRRLKFSQVNVKQYFPMSCDHPIREMLDHAVALVDNMRACVISMASLTGNCTFGRFFSLLFVQIRWCFFRDEVAWDIDTIYLSHDTRILNLRDFDHLEPK